MVCDPFMCCWIPFASILLLIRSNEQVVATTLDLLTYRLIDLQTYRLIDKTFMCHGVGNKSDRN